MRSLKQACVVIASLFTLLIMTHTAFAQQAKNIVITPFDDAIIHTYVSPFAPFRDVSQIVETPQGLVIIDPQSLVAQGEEFAAYVKNLNKPVLDVFLATHMFGKGYFKNVPVVATSAMAKCISNGTYKHLAKKFKTGFGDAINTNPYVPTKVISTDKLTMGGLTYTLTTRGPKGGIPSTNFELEKNKVAFRHLAGNNVHLLIPTPMVIEPTIADMKNLKSKGYTLLLSSHYAPAQGPEAFDYMVNYMTTAHKALAACATGKEYTTYMKKAFPKAGAEGFLNMSAKMLYSTKNTADRKKN